MPCLNFARLFAVQADALFIYLFIYLFVIFPQYLCISAIVVPEYDRFIRYHTNLLFAIYPNLQCYIFQVI
jgi:hypothetical protein